MIALCHAAQALSATILADTNRDGKVDIVGSSDSEDKQTWTNDRGALFLANIGDTDQRCSKSILPNTTRDEIDDCHDATDNVLRNTEYLAPLVTLPIADLSNDAHGFINVTDEIAAKNVRIFVKDGEEWDYVKDCHAFTSEQLSSGLKLGVDGRDVRRAGGWDGRVTVHFTVIDGEDSATDSVALRVAPVLVHHHAQPIERVFTTSDDARVPQVQYNIDLKNAVVAAGISEPIYAFEHFDIWTQDFFETAYSSIPGPDGEPIVLRIFLRSFQDRPSGALVFSELRAASVSAVQEVLPGDTIDSTGNLETIPPYTLGDKTYPVGRVIMGSWDGRLPHVFKFLQAQEVQEPVELDTSWLLVGHVDEFVQFLPAPDTERGWVIMIDDPLAGLELLKKASDAGHGGVQALSRPKLDSDSDSWCLPEITLDEVLNLPNFTTMNEHAAERVNFNLEILKLETGITDDEIFRIPALFYDFPGWECTPPNSSFRINANEAAVPDIIQATGSESNRPFAKRQTSVLQTIAHWPGAINGVVLSDSLYLAPNPWGPVIDGKDIIAEAVVEAYAAAANFSVRFMDDWYSHHTGGGEVHCGSNVWRTTDTQWW